MNKIYLKLNLVKREGYINNKRVRSIPFVKTTHGNVVVIHQIDNWLPPSHSSFLSVLVGKDEVFLSSEETFLVREEVPGDVVEDGVFGLGIPEIEHEHGLEVHVSAQGARPFGLAKSGRADEYEGFRPILNRVRNQ